jgi:hypothetical protein
LPLVCASAGASGKLVASTMRIEGKENIVSPNVNQERSDNKS